MEYIAFFMIVLYHSSNLLDYLVRQYDDNLLSEYEIRRNLRRNELKKFSFCEEKVNWKKEGF